MTYTHAPTGLKGVDSNSDREVIFNGDTIGRVMQIESGPKQGRWSYFGQWTGGGHKSGTLDTMERKRLANPPCLGSLMIDSVHQL